MVVSSFLNVISFGTASSFQVVAGSKQWNGEPVSESTKMQQAGLQPQHMPSHDLQTLPEAIARDIPLLTVDDFQAWAASSVCSDVFRTRARSKF